MTVKEFKDLRNGEKVWIRNRIAYLDGSTQFGHDGKYMWGLFRYADTGRKATKRNRQVGRISIKQPEGL